MAASEGRIGFDELEERLTAALAARTYAELEAVVADLPGPQPARRRTSVLPASPVARAAIALAIAIPVMVAAVVAVTAFLSAWIIWAMVGWYVFGHHRRHGRYRHGHGPRHRQPDPGAGPRFWA
jgi:hypothetical protein